MKRLLLALALLVPVATVTPASATVTWWQPSSAHALPLHWVLGGPLDTSDPKQMGLRDFSGNTLPAPAVYDIDGESNSAATVAYLHSLGKKVICYFDAGVYETYRSDASSFPKSVIGKADNGWNGSYWLDIRQISVLQPIMQKRVQMCKDKGFDAIEPDEINGWENDSGFPLTYADQIAYNRAVTDWAHAANLTALLKGDISQIPDLVNNFDATLNEECFQYNECLNPYDPTTDSERVGLQAFVNEGKAVWVAEYKSTASKWTKTCATSLKQHFNTARYKLGLPNNGGRQPCPGTW